MSYREPLLATPALNHVLGYAGRGWPVLPVHTENGTGCSCGKADCASPGKHPRTPHGLKDASRDEAQIRSWAQKYPGCNWAVTTGPESGIFVLDVDGTQGEQSLSGFEEKYGERFQSLSVNTPHGGQIYFQHPMLAQGLKIKNSVRKIAPGLDIRGADGYVLVPPSRLHDGDYTWRDGPDAPILEASDWLLGQVVQASNRAESGNATAQTLPSVEPLAGAVIPEGERNSTLTSLAGTMRRRGMSAHAIEAALQAENVARCTPPLSTD